MQYPKNSDMRRYVENNTRGDESFIGKFLSSSGEEDHENVSLPRLKEEFSDLRIIKVDGKYNFVNHVIENYKPKRLNIFVDSANFIIDSFFF